MKINNTVVGFLLLNILPVFFLWDWYQGFPKWIANEDTIVDFFVNCFGVMILFGEFVALIVSLLTGELEFQVNIPNPFSPIIDYYKNKSNMEKKREELLERLFHANSDSEIDMINKKIELLRSY